jgi:methyl-accepting chemotaxis protein
MGGRMLSESVAGYRRIAHVPMDARDPVRANRLPYELKGYIEDLYGVSLTLVLPGTATTDREMAISRLQLLAWEVREYGGRARTFYAIATLTQQPIPQAYVGEAKIDTSRAKAAWDQINLVTKSVDLPPELTSAIRDVTHLLEQRYFGALDQLDAAFKQLNDGAEIELPFSFNAFFELSNIGLGAIADIAPLAGTHIQNYWSERVRMSKQVRVMSGLALVVMIVLAFFAIYALQKKIASPIQAATEALSEIARGNLERKFRKRHTRFDEIRVIWDGLEELSNTLRVARDKDAAQKEAEQRAKEGIIGDLQVAFERMAQGDLTHQIEDRYGEAYSGLIQNLNSACKTLDATVSGVVENAMEIAEDTQRLSAAVGDLSQRTDTQTTLVCQCRSKIPQKCRSNFPHFRDLVTSQIRGLS